MCAPYQVELDKGNIIFVPEDSNRCIRATDKEDVDPRYSVPMPPEDGPYPTLRCGHGQRVICNVGSRWEIGVVEEMFWRGSVRPAIPTGKCAPYQVLLDGDEEATFWTLVTLLRQLPPLFYARAPLPRGAARPSVGVGGTTERSRP